MEKAIKAILVVGLVAAATVFIGRGLVALTSGTTLIGSFAEDGERGGCPSTDNCVSSYAPAGTPWAIDPLACEATPLEAELVFAEAMRSLPDVESVSARAWIVYSRTFRFPDDVRIDVTSRGIEVISSSRLGAGDLGVNRKRVEALRLLVEADPRCTGTA